MKLRKSTWITLGVGIFIVAAVVIYMLYRGELSKQREVRDSLDEARTTNTLLLSQKSSLQAELDSLKEEYTQWQDQISQLQSELSQETTALNQTKAKFPQLVQSIEYGQTLFAFAQSHNLEVTGLTAAEPTSESVENIPYSATSLKIDVRGEVADILDFINTITTSADFQAAVLEPVNMTIPKPLLDEEKSTIEEGIRQNLVAGAVAQLTSEDIMGFMLEAVKEVSGQTIDARTIEDMATTIRAEIVDSVEEHVLELLPGDLAQLIVEHISGSIVQQVVTPLAQDIYDLIVDLGPGETLTEALNGLLGADIAGLLGEEIGGVMPGDITNLLDGYIAQLVEEKMTAAAGAKVEDLVQATTAQTIKEKEMTSATITLVIYGYEGESNGQ